MPVRKALVLSGGGLFGAWQAGAWQVLEPHFTPDLVVGASIGSLMGYLIAGGVSSERILELWRDRNNADFRHLDTLLERVTQEVKLRLPFAVTMTDLRAMKMRIVRDQDVRWQHLSASIAVPLALPQKKIDGRWYSDGGLLNPLPAWAAVELGAVEILALHCLPNFPSPVLKPFVQLFRATFGHNPPIPAEVKMQMILPSRKLGGLRDALQWKEDNIERWIELGRSDAKTALPLTL